MVDKVMKLLTKYGNLEAISISDIPNMRILQVMGLVELNPKDFTLINNQRFPNVFITRLGREYITEHSPKRVLDLVRSVFGKIKRD